MKTVYILRGLPGSGKSTLAQALSSLFKQSVTCSADDFFESPEGYKYDKTRIRFAHEACKALFETSAKVDVDNIIVDNTNTQPWEYEWYKQKAKEYGYSVTIIRVDTDLTDEELAKRNTHGVPVETIKKMRERFK